MCQHGDRRVARLESPLKPGTKPAAKFVNVADRWEGKRFNSPNDLVLQSNGAVYFTDPRYGLDKGGDPSTAEIDFMGVYRCGPDGKVTLATRAMTKPNGLAFSPDEKILYIGQSDSEAAIWRAFDVQPDNSARRRAARFLRLDSAREAGVQGPSRRIQGRQGREPVRHRSRRRAGDLEGGQAPRHDLDWRVDRQLHWGDDGSTLYMTSHMYLARVKTKTHGAGV